MVTIYYRHIRSGKLTTLNSPKAGSWVHASTPTPTELQDLANTYQLDPGLLTDGIDPNESPRVETEDGATYIYTRYAYGDDGRIYTSPLLIVLGDSQIITISGRKFGRLSNLIEGRQAIVTTQKTKLLLQILAEVQMSYTTNLNYLSKTILGFRRELRKENISNQDLINFIDIEETLHDFWSGLVPMGAIFRSLLTGRYFRLYEEDEDLIEDLSLGITELIELTKSRLTNIVNIREAYSTILAGNLNRTFRRLTLITIFMTIPMIVSSLYGMNIPLPYMNQPWAFTGVMASIMVSMLAAAYMFRRNHWM